MTVVTVEFAVAQFSVSLFEHKLKTVSAATEIELASDDMFSGLTRELLLDSQKASLDCFDSTFDAVNVGNIREINQDRANQCSALSKAEEADVLNEILTEVRKVRSNMRAVGDTLPKIVAEAVRSFQPPVEFSAMNRLLMDAVVRENKYTVDELLGKAGRSYPIRTAKMMFDKIVTVENNHSDEVTDYYHECSKEERVAFTIWALTILRRFVDAAVKMYLEDKAAK